MYHILITRKIPRITKDSWFFVIYKYINLIDMGIFSTEDEKVSIKYLKSRGFCFGELNNDCVFGKYVKIKYCDKFIYIYVTYNVKTGELVIFPVFIGSAITGRKDRIYVGSKTFKAYTLIDFELVVNPHYLYDIWMEMKGVL
jgi:hypothetical protein